MSYLYHSLVKFEEKMSSQLVTRTLILTLATAIGIGVGIATSQVLIIQDCIGFIVSFLLFLLLLSLLSQQMQKLLSLAIAFLIGIAFGHSVIDIDHQILLSALSRCCVLCTTVCLSTIFLKKVNYMFLFISISLTCLSILDVFTSLSLLVKQEFIICLDIFTQCGLLAGDIKMLSLMQKVFTDNAICKWDGNEIYNFCKVMHS